MRKRPCLLFACIFLTGITCFKYSWKLLRLMPIFALFAEVYYGSRLKISRRKMMRRIAGRSVILLSAFFLGINTIKSQEEFRSAYMSKLKDNSNAVIYGEISKIEETDYGCRLILTDCYVHLKEENIPCNRIMVYASSDQFQIGQIYQIKGQLHFFEGARNEGNFDSALFYQSQKIDFYLYEESSVLLDANDNFLRNGILSLKRYMETAYKRCLKEEPAGFYMGIILGDKAFLSQETKDLFAAGGISHILAISGLHMSVIGRGLYTWLRKRRVSFLVAGFVAGVVLLAYCFMVGSGVSVIRAVGMMLLFFLSQYIGRSYDMLNALGAVVIYLLWENPFLIEYSGFHFSVAALLGVGFVGKHMWMSLGITLATLPIVALNYYEVPLYSSLVNAILLPMLTPIFVLALFGALLGGLVPSLGTIVLIPCSWLFYFYEFVCELVKKLPFGTVITGKPEMKIILVYYGFLFFVCTYLERKRMSKDEANDEDNRKSNKNILLCVVVSVICFSIILWPKTPKSEIIFLDVGQGDGIYIGSEDGSTYFIDGGSSDIRQVGNYRILPFLKAHGIKKIDYWFITHTDADHMSGFLEVMEEGYDIGALVISDKMPEDESRERLIGVAKEQNLEILLMGAGDRIESSQMKMACLYPVDMRGDKNEQSLVLQVEFREKKGNCIFKGLFSGDISSEVERALIKEGLLSDVDLYKAAHHGSKYSNSEQLLNEIQPEVCIVSCGIDNSYGHPHIEVLERLEDMGCEVYLTAEFGQITIDLFSCMNPVSLVK